MAHATPQSAEDAPAAHVTPPGHPPHAAWSTAAVPGPHQKPRAHIGSTRAVADGHANEAGHTPPVPLEEPPPPKALVEYGWQ